MSGFIAAWPTIWAQMQVNAPPAAAANLPSRDMLVKLMWLFLASDPWFTTNDLVGGLMTWFKVMGLLCMVCWAVAWMVTGVQKKVVGRGQWYDYLGVAAMVLTPVTVMLRVLESAQRLEVYQFRGVNLTTAITFLCAVLYLIWAEVAIARTVGRYGRRLDGWVLFGVHAALAAGVAVGLFLQHNGYLELIVPTRNAQGQTVRQLVWRDGLFYGLRIGATYMGYVVFLRVVALLLPEVVAVRGAGCTRSPF